jgi:hypothetical protein
LGGFILPAGLLVCREGSSGARRLSGLGLGVGGNFGIAWWNDPKHKRILIIGEELQANTVMTASYRFLGGHYHLRSRLKLQKPARAVDTKKAELAAIDAICR